MHCYRTAALYIYNHLNILFLFGTEWPAYLCFFSPVVSASDRNSVFSSDSSIQLPAAAVAPDQRKRHQNQKVLKNNSTHLSQGEAFRCFQHAPYYFHSHSFPLHLQSRTQQLL